MRVCGVGWRASELTPVAPGCCGRMITFCGEKVSFLGWMPLLTAVLVAPPPSDEALTILNCPDCRSFCGDWEVLRGMAILVGDLPVVVVSPLLVKMSLVGVVAEGWIEDTPSLVGDSRLPWVTTIVFVGLLPTVTPPPVAAADCACAPNNCDVTGAERTISDVEAAFVPEALPVADPVGIACTFPLPGFFVIMTLVTTWPGAPGRFSSVCPGKIVALVSVLLAVLSSDFAVVVTLVPL